MNQVIAAHAGNEPINKEIVNMCFRAQTTAAKIMDAKVQHIVRKKTA